MENSDKRKKKEYKQKWIAAENKISQLQSDFKLIVEERDRLIGEKCLATAKFKECSEELQSMQSRFHALENTYIKQKIEHINMMSAHESLKEDSEVMKKMLTIRDKEIQGLSKQQEIKRKPKPETPSRKELKPPHINNNIRPFPSTSFSFNLISSNKNSFTSSFREEEH